MHYPIRIAPLWRLLLLPFGISRDNAFVDVGANELRARFGVADYQIALAEIESLRLATWPVWAGVGWRADLSGTVALIGTPSRAVEVRLRQRRPIGRLGVPCERLLITVEHPEQFIEEVSPLLEQGKRSKTGAPRRAQAQTKRKPGGRSTRTQAGKRSKAA